jgi:Mn-dependent DtxR family transcriptional regulator
MIKESDILKIVKEDILRVLGEERYKKTSLERIKPKVKVSSQVLRKAIEALEKEGLILLQGRFISLTKRGQPSAKNIVKKHLVLENYFKKTRSERQAHKAAHVLEHYVSNEAMNNIKKLSTLKEKDIPLVEIELRKEALITNISFRSSKLFERVISMGIFPGERIKITNKIANGVVVKVKNKKFALEKNIARGIRVLEHERA